MSEATLFQHPFSRLHLHRWPRYRNERLRAWDGADLLALETVAEQATPGQSLLVLNDDWGALSLALLQAGFQVSASGDSWLAWQGMCCNARDNDLDPDSLDWFWPQQSLPWVPERVLIRVPKSLDLLAWQLRQLSRQLPQGTPLLLPVMDKHAPATLMALLGQHGNNPGRSLGRHKAHVYRVESALPLTEPLPDTIRVPDLAMPLEVLPGVFSRRQLDIGARLLLPHLGVADGERVVDLGCGSGVLGLLAAQRAPGAQVMFADESAQAVACACANAERLFPGRAFGFHLGNGLEGVGGGPFDRVLLNPPFHRGHSLETRTAHTLIRQAAEHLRPGGELRMVANRHLDYRPILKRLFRSSRLLASDRKFVVLAASR